MTQTTLDKLNEEIALKSIINHALNVFPKSFINHSNELIIDPRNHISFRLEDVTTVLEFKCKVFAWVSRPIAKSLNKYWSPRVLDGVNRLLQTNFSKDDMWWIYDRLGNDINRNLAIKFVESNYDMDVLGPREDI